MRSSDKKAVTLLQHLIARDDFQKDVLVIRKKYGIPINGFSDVSCATDWMADMHDYLWLKETNYEFAPNTFDEDKFLPGLKKDYDQMLKKYRIPLTIAPSFMRYLLHDNTLSHEHEIGFGCEIIDPLMKHNALDNWMFSETREEQWKKSGDKFIYLLIPDSVNRSDVKNYIDNIWSEIKRRLGTSESGKIPRIRSKTNFNRDRYAFGLSLKSIKDIKSELKKFGSDDWAGSKHELIALAVYKKFGKKVLASAIEKAIKRYRRLLNDGTNNNSLNIG